MTNHLNQKRKYLEPGTILDERFEIVEFLGAGSFGEVYRARQLIFGHAFRNVALKLFAEGKVTSENAYDVLNDAAILVGLQEEPKAPDAAKRLVQVYDMGLIQTPVPRAFMSMKLIPGRKTLRSEIRRLSHGEGMLVSTTLRYLRQILIPLAWMHGLELPVVHGDLKPENILFTEDFDIVITDFGLAARMPLGTIGGTIPYDAPEKFYDNVVAGPKADVYSVGIIWYEMLTGVHPFDKVGIEATARGDHAGYMNAHREARGWPICSQDDERLPTDGKRIIPASELNPDLAEQHPQLESVLNRCLTNDILKRYDNARVLLEQIDKYIKEGHIPDTDMEVIKETMQEETEADTECELKKKTTEDIVADAKEFIRQGKPDKALKLADDVLMNTCNYVPALLIKAKALTKMAGRLNEAEEICAKAKNLAPDEPDVFEVAAEIRAAQGKTMQAQMLRAEASSLRASRSSRTRRGS